MSHIFYFFILFPMVWEMIVITHPVKITNLVKSFKGLKVEDITPRQRRLGNYMLGYLIWCFVGLVTNQWVFFLVLVILGLIPKNKPVTTLLNGVLSLATLVLIILNEYQFNVNVYSLIKSWF